MGGSIQASKARLRREFAALGHRADPASAGRASAAACAHLVASLPFASMTRLVLYAARGCELDPGGVAEAAARRGVATYYPRVEGDGLRFRRCHAAELGSGAYGIAEPPASGDELPPDEADASVLFVVPGVAFDRAGTRLGSGHGFFDRALPRYPRATRIGMVASAALVERLPSDPWDVRMHAIVTEEGLLTVDDPVGVSLGEST